MRPTTEKSVTDIFHTIGQTKQLVESASSAVRDAIRAFEGVGKLRMQRFLSDSQRIEEF